ncbi:MAG: Sir2 family NAD-dependent protein deacetylase [Mucinivorans sp.]
MKKIVVFTGAGMSADSGLATFRGGNGLWASYRIEDVCRPEALVNNRKMVIEFYNTRRREMLEAQPNAGHRAIAALGIDKNVDLQIITQNIDNLHERAGEEIGVDRPILHLHGELTKLRSSQDQEAIVPLDGWRQKLEARHDDGSLLRPFVVFFGESVPLLPKAIEIVAQADIMIIVGTSLSVYPAAYLVDYLPRRAPIYVVDPGPLPVHEMGNTVVHYQENSAQGLPMLVERLRQECAQG